MDWKVIIFNRLSILYKKQEKKEIIRDWKISQIYYNKKYKVIEVLLTQLADKMVSIVISSSLKENSNFVNFKSKITI